MCASRLAGLPAMATACCHSSMPLPGGGTPQKPWLASATTTVCDGCICSIDTFLARKHPPRLLQERWTLPKGRVWWAPLGARQGPTP